MSSKVIHFEILTDNTESTITFFEKAFDWSFWKLNQNDSWVINTGYRSLGINGALIDKTNFSQSVINFIHTENMEESIRKIEKYGGKLIGSRKGISEGEFMTYFEDPNGYLFGLYKCC